MTYLLSLLSSESFATDRLPLEKEFDSLCYYVNDTKFTQNVQVIVEHECVSEHLIFPGERMLFEAPDRAYIKVITFLLDCVKMTEIECKWLQIAEKHDPESALR